MCGSAFFHEGRRGPPSWYLISFAGIKRVIVMSQIILGVSETARLIAVYCQRRVAQRLSLVCTGL